MQIDFLDEPSLASSAPQPSRPQPSPTSRLGLSRDWPIRFRNSILPTRIFWAPPPPPIRSKAPSTKMAAALHLGHFSASPARPQRRHRRRSRRSLPPLQRRRRPHEGLGLKTTASPSPGRGLSARHGTQPQGLDFTTACSTSSSQPASNPTARSSTGTSPGPRR